MIVKYNNKLDKYLNLSRLMMRKLFGYKLLFTAFMKTLQKL